MRDGKKIVIAAVLVAGSLAAIPVVEAATPPAVTAVIQGSDGTSDQDTLIVTGTKLNKFKTFSLTFEPGGAAAGSPTLLVKGKTQITLLLPGGLTPGRFNLSMQPKKGDPLIVPFTLQGPPLVRDAENGSTTVNGVHGSTSAADFAGVRGGVFAATGDGVHGVAWDTAGSGVGVRGLSFGVDGIGVIANVTSDGGPNSAALQADHSGTQGVIARFQSQGFTVADIDHDGKGTFAGGLSAGGETIDIASNRLHVGTLFGDAKLVVNGEAWFGVTAQITQAPSDVVALQVNKPNGNIVMQLWDTGSDVWALQLETGDAFKPGGGSWGVFSDARLKKNVENVDGALDRLLALRSVTFEYEDPAAVHGLPGRQTGFIAQEVEQVFPDWVGEREDGMKYVSVKGFESLTVAALRELRAEKDAQIEALEAKSADLEARLATLERALLGKTEEAKTSTTTVR